MKATAEQLRGNLSGFKKAVRRRDLEIERLQREIAGHLKAWDIEHAEVVRLRAQLWTDDEVEHEMALARVAIIEECARVAESDKWDDYLRPQPHIADAIRALKDEVRNAYQK